MELYEILKNLVNHNYYEKEDMIKKLNVFYAYNQISLEQYTELMQIINPQIEEKKDKVEEHKETKKEE